MSITVDDVAPSELRELRELAETIAGNPDEWAHRVRLSTDGRWYERIHVDAEREVWLISWLPGQATGFHDHGGSRGAFAVALGSLEENDMVRARAVPAGETRSFGPEFVHDVRNVSDAPAISIHVYSPPLSVMNRYDVGEDGPVALVPERAGDW